MLYLYIILIHMKEYTIYCTPGQTKRAFRLGAPIAVNAITDEPMLIYTAEQMIGWLEGNGILDIVISRNMSPTTFGYTVWFTCNSFEQERHQFDTRQDATLAAIDIALDYLINKNKQS